MTGTETGTRGLDIVFEESDWGFKGKNYLFTIGIDNYEHWNPLNCAVKDVDDFTNILLKRYQFKKEDVLQLKDKEATTKNILIKLREIAKKITEQDNLVVYFSGHGHYDEATKSGFWIPVDAHLGEDFEYEFLNTAIIVDKLKAINSLHTFLIIDACFSGTLMAQLKSAPRSERFKSRRVFTSGRAEVVVDGPKGGNSPFAKGILVSLTNNIAPFLRVSELIVEVINYVEREAKQTLFNGVLLNSDDQGGDFVFHLKIHEDELWSKTLEKNTVEGYKKFMETFPESAHFEESREAFVWGTAVRTDTISAYQAYIDAYRASNGTYVDEAIKKQRSLESASLWKRTLAQDSISGYNHFIFIFPESPYAEEAKRRIQQKGSEPVPMPEEGILLNRLPLPDHSAELLKWQEAKEINTYMAYLSYSRAFPESDFADEARQIMRSLDNIALNRIKIMEANEGISLTDKIAACIRYFREYQGAQNTNLVKQIKDRLEIMQIKRGL